MAKHDEEEAPKLEQMGGEVPEMTGLTYAAEFPPQHLTNFGPMFIEKLPRGARIHCKFPTYVYRDRNNAIVILASVIEDDGK